MSNLIFTGKVTQISEPQTGTSIKGDWTKSVIVVEDDAQYPNSIAFDAFNKKEIVDSVNIGDLVDILYNAAAAPYNGKMYNTLSLWKIDVKELGSNSTIQSSTPKATASPKATSSVEDDLPF